MGGEEVCLFECCCGRGVSVECVREGRKGGGGSKGREEGEGGGRERNAPRAMKNLS